MIRLSALRTVFVLLAFFVCCLFFYGCGENKKDTIYVPKKWKSTECIYELRSTWMVSLTKCGANIDSDEQMRKLVQRVWEAEKSGKTDMQIDDAFETRSAKDIVDNGI